MENELSKVKVNNEMDFCSVSDIKTKAMLEKAFMRAGISYFLRWEKPSFIAKLFGGAKPNMVFCINSAQIEKAQNVIDDLGNLEGDFKLLYSKSNNKMGF